MSALDSSHDVSSHGPLHLAEGIDFSEIGRILWRRIWVIFWSVVIVLSLGATVVFSLTPRYTASASVEINPRQTKILNFEEVLSGLPANAATMETEIEILRSRMLASRAVANLDLIKLPEFNPALRAPSPQKMAMRWVLVKLDSVAEHVVPGSPEEDAKQTGAAGERNANPGGWSSQPARSVQRLLVGLSSEREKSTPEGTALSQVLNVEKNAVIDAFDSRLSVRPKGKSRVIAINFASEDPEIAAKAANTVADLYIVSQLEAKFEAAKRANAWLNERIADLRQEVRAREKAVEEFRNKSGLIQGGTQATLTGEQVTALNARYINERTVLAEVTARLRQAESLLKSPRGIETAGEVLNSPNIRALRAQQTLVERKVAELSNEYGERHPRMISARAEKADIIEKIRLEIDKIIQSLRNDFAVARARTQSVRSELEGLKADVAKLNAAEVQLRALDREATASRQLLVQLLTRSKETASQTNFQQPDATIITAATIPDSPTFPKTGMLILLLVALGTGIGLFGAVVVDRLDQGYRSADEITRQLGVASLGLVPAVSKLRSRGKDVQTYCVENPTSAFSEAMRSLHTNLLLTDVGNRPSVVLVASALPNEGKTSTVVALARLLAHVGQSVIVIDCDLRQPSIAKAFGVKDGPGLGECVYGKAPLEDVIQEDSLTPAHFLRAGERPPNFPDLFDSVAFQQLLKTLSRNYDLVLLDSAPVLAVSDTLFLGRLADKTVLVVRWAMTRRATVDLALKKLQGARARVAGVLLSMVDVKGLASYSYSDSGSYSGELKRYYGR
jgi:capsular exopolysaccharide synthesis family protein